MPSKSSDNLSVKYLEGARNGKQNLSHGLNEQRPSPDHIPYTLQSGIGDETRIS